MPWLKMMVSWIVVLISVAALADEPIETEAPKNGAACEGTFSDLAGNLVTGQSAMIYLAEGKKSKSIKVLLGSRKMEIRMERVKVSSHTLNAFGNIQLSVKDHSVKNSESSEVVYAHITGRNDRTRILDMDLTHGAKAHFECTVIALKGEQVLGPPVVGPQKDTFDSVRSY